MKMAICTPLSLLGRVCKNCSKETQPKNDLWRSSSHSLECNSSKDLKVPLLTVFMCDKLCIIKQTLVSNYTY